MSTDNEQDDALIGARLCLLREEKGMTQSGMAKSLKVSLRTYQNYERGDRPISKQVLCELALKSNVDLNWLLTGIKKEEAKQTKAAHKAVQASMLSYICSKLGEELFIKERFIAEDYDLYYPCRVYNEVLAALGNDPIESEEAYKLADEIAASTIEFYKHTVGSVVIDNDGITVYEGGVTTIHKGNGIVEVKGGDTQNLKSTDGQTTSGSMINNHKNGNK